MKHQYDLSGCRSKPLASYLKAVGLLRLLCEQKDPGARGWWGKEKFVVQTSLDRGQLMDFFCREYVPTPVIAPWNGGSGFYLGDNQDGMNAILESPDERFRNYKDVILQVQSWPEIPVFKTVKEVYDLLEATLASMGSGKKRDDLEEMLGSIEGNAPSPELLSGIGFLEMSLDDVESSAKKGVPEKSEWSKWWNSIKKARTYCNTIKRAVNKTAIIPLCRARLPESCLPWLDAVCAIGDHEEFSYNPVLGTGGNEGRLDFSNTFMKRVSELFINGAMESTRRLFDSAVFETVIPELVYAKIGQYDPGRAGGYNQGMEIETKEFKINPWDFILAIEGALLLGGAVTRRNPTNERSHYTAPFTVNFSPVGFSSSSSIESGRYETWLPLWSNPASINEVRYHFGEGRANLGRNVAKTGVEFSRAVGSLGVDRGINAFERFIFLERRGQNKVALPAGRINVMFKPQLHLLHELDTALRPVLTFLRTIKNVPATFVSARRNIDNAIFACTQKPDPIAFNNLTREIGCLERVISTHNLSDKPMRPLLGLSPKWVAHCDDGSVEVRIAAALASIRSTGKVGPIRTNVSGVNPGKPWQWDASRKSCWFGNSLHERMCSVAKYRLMDGERTSAEIIPFDSFLSISPHDVMPFLGNECDDTKIEELFWAFMLVDWIKDGLSELRKSWSEPLDDEPLSRAYCLLKLLHLPNKIRNPKTGASVAIRQEPRISQLLSANRLKEACDIAIRRLGVSDLNPFNVTHEEPVDAHRMLASLLLPISGQWKLESLVMDRKTNKQE